MPDTLVITQTPPATLVVSSPGPQGIPGTTAQAAAIVVADAGGYFSTKNVEAALQQLAAILAPPVRLAVGRALQATEHAVIADTSGGTFGTLTTTASPAAWALLVVLDPGKTLATSWATNALNLQANAGQAIEDPQSPGNVVAAGAPGLTLSQRAAAYTWQWLPAPDSFWKFVR